VAVAGPYSAPDALGIAPVRVSRQQTSASCGSRLASFLMDTALLLLVLLPLVLSVTVFEPRSKGADSTFFLSFFGIIALAIYQMVLLSRNGQTLGKRAMSIRIVRSIDGGNPGFRRVVGLRFLVNVLMWMVPIYALLDVLYIFSKEKRCLHDHIAGTKVVEA
jgi:uncharacterized RDD family membrane protein YckC